MNHKELNKLAAKVAAGQVASLLNVPAENWHILYLISNRQLKELEDRFIWEDFSKAMPTSVNGYPVFYSFKSVPKEDTPYLLTRIEWLQKRCKLPFWLYRLLKTRKKY